jgi:hypothetical protein
MSEQTPSLEGTLVLVEMDARRPGSHWSTAIPLLARAAGTTGMRCLLVTSPPGAGMPPLTAAQTGGAEILTPGTDARRGGPATRLLWAGARVLDLLHRRLDASGRLARVSSQALIFSRCLADAAALRLGHAVATAPAVSVLLGARANLPAFTAALGGPHIRVIHYVRFSEGGVRGLCERIFRRHLRRVGAVATTDRAHRAVANGHLPGATIITQPFALQEEGAYVSEDERTSAAKALSVDGAQPVISLIGGWRAGKDVGTVVDAIALVRTPFTLLVAGAPLDERMLAAIRERHAGDLRVLDHVLSNDEYRQAFAASDFTLVSRVDGGQESGIGIHALMFGTRLIIASHEAIVTDASTDQPWVVPFTGGDAESLAATIEACLAEPPPRPPADAARAVGVVTPEDRLRTFYELHAAISR